jgi:hypothetical protein
MVAPKKSRSGSETQFPGKLHDMMRFVGENALESIISWELNGYGIKINHPERLVEILPQFFGQTKYRSFRRQLNMWHFHRILVEGPNKDIFVHPYFVQHNRDLCAQMSRQIAFKPTIQKEQEYITLRTSCCIEPDPIMEPSFPLDMKVSRINATENTGNDIDGFFQLSDFCLPSSTPSSSSLPPLPPLSNQSTKSSLDAALKTLEHGIGGQQQNIAATVIDGASLPLSSTTREQDFMVAGMDGELGSFEGKNFFFVENAAPC